MFKWTRRGIVGGLAAALAANRAASGRTILPRQEDAPASGVPISADDPRIEAGYHARAAFWDKIGPSDDDFISYLINPQFEGKPAWPNTRQAYRVVRPPGALIIASDGLSDPFVGTSTDHVSGFGMEVFIETGDLADADVETLRASWAFRLIESFAMSVADWGNFVQHVRRYGVASLELPADDVLPAAWLTRGGMAGFLVNMPAAGRAAEVALPFGPALMVPLTLLRPAELALVIDGGAAARRQVADRLDALGSGHRSSLTRPSVA